MSERITAPTAHELLGENKRLADTSDGGIIPRFVRKVNEVHKGVQHSERRYSEDFINNILASFGIQKINDYVHIQRQVLKTLIDEGFFTDNENRRRFDVNVKSGMVIETNKSGIDETFCHANFIRLGKFKKISKLATIRLLPEIIQNGELIDDDVPNVHNNGINKKFAYIEYNVSIDGNDITVRLAIKKSPQKNKFWVHSIYETENVSDSPASTNNGTEAGHITADFGNIISDSPSKSNEEIVNNEEQLSERTKVPTAHELLGENKRLEDTSEKGIIPQFVQKVNEMHRKQSEVASDGEQLSERERTRITADMSDEERTRILSGKSIVAPIYDGQADETILYEEENLLSKEDTIFKAAIKRIGEQFNAFTDEEKPIDVKDMDFGVFFSRGGADESSKKKVTDIKQLAKILPILRDSVEHSIGIECHSNRYFADHNTNEFYELIGGYIDGEDFIPVRFGVKGFKDGTYSLYVVVCQDKIKKTNVTEPSSSDLNGSQNGSRLVSDISISRIAKFVKGKDLLRYLPDGMLDDNQREIKYEGIAETIKYTNDKNDKKYRKFIKKQDKDSARRMVLAAAKANEYTYEAWHGTRATFTKFSRDKLGSNTRTETSKRWFFAADKDTANSYYPYGVIEALYGKEAADKLKNKGNLYHLYLKMENPLIVDVADYDYAAHREKADAWIEFVEQAEKDGNDGIILLNALDNQLRTSARESTVYMFREPSQAKSADTVTYDDDGKVIPISQRFNSEDDDTRNSERTTAPTAHELLGENKRLEKELRERRADAERLRKILELEKKVYDGIAYDVKRVGAVAEYLLKEWDSKYDKLEMEKRLREIYDYIIANGGEFDLFELERMSTALAEDVLAMAKVKTERPAYYDKILSEIRSARIAPSDVQKAEAKYHYDTGYMKKYFGWVTVAEENSPF